MIVLGIFAMGTQVFVEMFIPPKDATPIYVVGKQWMWKVQHPQGRSEINEIHLPLGRPVRLIMTSQDVIHSFYIPAFRMKQDVLPGRLTSEWFQPNKVGPLPPVLRRVLRDRALEDGRLGRGDGAGRLREVAQGGPDGSGGGSSDAAPSMATTGARLFEKYHCTGCHGMPTPSSGPPSSTASTAARCRSWPPTARTSNS